MAIQHTSVHVVVVVSVVVADLVVDVLVFVVQVRVTFVRRLVRVDLCWHQRPLAKPTLHCAWQHGVCQSRRMQ